MKTDFTTDLVATRLAQAIRDYVPRYPTKFRKLLPMKDSIAELRDKGASYAAIAEILRNINVPVASDTIFRFCHEVLDEPMTRSRKRRKMPARVPTERADRKPVVDEAAGVRKQADSRPVPSWKMTGGPHIADPNTI
jgi:hypothetical protein